MNWFQGKYTSVQETNKSFINKLNFKNSIYRYFFKIELIIPADDLHFQCVKGKSYLHFHAYYLENEEKIDPVHVNFQVFQFLILNKDLF